MIADDGVMLRPHLKAGMLVRDAVDHSAKLVEAVDVRRVSED